MFAIKQIAKNFCRTVIQPKLDKGGFAGAASEACAVLFYSGPSDELLESILLKEGPKNAHLYIPNWQVAGKEAERLNATRLDNTKIFSFLFSQAFTSLVNKLPLSTTKESDEVVKYVWDYVSDKFSRTPFKKAATLVCGADKKSSFYAKEIDGILDNESVKIINERPADMFRAFRALGKAEVQRIMCVTALVEMRQHVQNNNAPQAWGNYKRQRKYFVVAQAEENKKIKALPPKERAKYADTRRSIVKAFKNPNRSTKGNTIERCLKIAL